MANNVSLPEVLVLDTAADTIVAAAIPVYVRKVRLSANTAAAQATITDAGGTVSKIGLSSLAGGSDETNFHDKPFKLNGLRLLSLSGAAAIVHVYTDSR